MQEWVPNTKGTKMLFIPQFYWLFMNTSMYFEINY